MRDAHYADPRLVDLYDGLNSADHDHRFYEARIGQDPLRVLDLGCGTGLFARRLAGAGHRVTGLDPSAAMLDWARAQDPVGLIAWHLGKIDDLPREARFDVVVMTGHAFQCLTRDEAVRATMADVRARLSPGGCFMFESRNPAARAWEGWTADRVAVVQDAAGRPVRVFTTVIEAANPIVRLCHHFAFPDEELRSQSTLLFLSRADIERYLAEAGFARVEVFGGWMGEPASALSPEIIVIAR